MRASRLPSCLAVLLTAGAVGLVGAAGPAAAASGITSPGDGSVVLADSVVPLRAVVDRPSVRPHELTLQAPSAQQAEVVAVQASPSGGELRYDFDTACATRVCSQRVPAENGRWTVRLVGDAQDERTFVLRIPPAEPTGLAAAGSGDGVEVSWQQGDEPDLVGYTVEDAQARVVRRGIGLDACDADRVCRAEVPADAGAWTVRALRSACPGCHELLSSTTPPAVSAQDTIAAPAGGPAPPAGGGAQVGDEPTAEPAPQAQRPDRRPDQRGAFSRVFGTGPVLPAAAAPVPPPSAPPPELPDGSYDVTLGFSPPEAATGGVPRPPAARARDAVDGLLSADRLPLLVLSAVLVGGAAWLRRWTRRAITD
jgi:hypothetical protein